LKRPELTQFIEITLRIQGCHAPRAGTGDGLPIDVVLHIAGGEDSGNTGLGGVALVAALGDQVATWLSISS
jgi:hypothetical protein